MDWDKELDKIRLFIEPLNYNELLKYKDRGYTLKGYQIKNDQTNIASFISREVKIEMVVFEPAEHYMSLTFTSFDRK